MLTQEIINYVKEARNSGLNSDLIKQRLTEHGWQESDINEALGLSGADLESQSLKSYPKIALFSYMGILILIPFAVAGGNSFIKFHLRQGLILFIAGIVSYIIRFLVPFGNWGYLINLVLFAFAIIGIINVLKGEMKPLPLIG